MTTETKPEIYLFGEDGEWAFGEGHIDPEAFIDQVKDDFGEGFDGDEYPMPSATDVRHVWAVDGNDLPDKFPDGYTVWLNITPETSGARPATIVQMID